MKPGRLCCQLSIFILCFCKKRNLISLTGYFRGATRFINNTFRKRISGRFVNGSLLPAQAKARHVNPTRVINEHPVSKVVHVTCRLRARFDQAFASASSLNHFYVEPPECFHRAFVSASKSLSDATDASAQNYNLDTCVNANAKAWWNRALNGLILCLFMVIIFFLTFCMFLTT